CVWFARPLALQSFPTRRSSDLCQSLHGDPDHVVEWLLGGERYTARLGVEAESGGLVARAVPLAHEARPEATCGTELLGAPHARRSEEHTSELQSRENLVCRLLL